MLQLQTLRLQKQQRLYKLVGKALDVLNVLLVNFVRDICSVGDLVDVVCDITRKIAESLHLIFVNVDDVSFKDHRTDKSAERVHTAVRKLSLDSVHLCLTHSYLQVQITLVLVFDLFSFPFSVFLNSGS